MCWKNIEYAISYSDPNIQLAEIAMGSLFPGLPDAIGLECLARVELDSHHNLRCVCKSWNAALKSPHFYQERKRLKLSEQRICILQRIDGICNRVAVYDLEKNSCKSLPPIPIPAETGGIYHCHFVNQKLVLIMDLVTDFRRSSVWLYDFACSKWRQGAKMPVCQEGTGFASAADEAGGLIYVGGGYAMLHNGYDMFYNGKPLRSASVYNVEEDKWDLLPEMNTSMEHFSGAFADGKFFVIGSSRRFEVFDSYTRSWKTMENRFTSLRFISAFGRFYCLSGRALLEYDYSQDKLHVVGCLPTKDRGRSINFAVVVSNKILVRKQEPHSGQSFYMLSPSSQTGGTLDVIGIKKPSGLQGSALRAATLDL